MSTKITKKSKHKIKVLAFTASSKRPIFLRHCVMQLQQQSYPLDHVVYVNSSDYKDHHDEHNYLELLTDITISNENNLKVGYGPSSSHHRNHMAAIRLINWKDYDLFFKIDDDDIYRKNYIKDAVDDYIERQWDFSGEMSYGHLLNNTLWKKNHHLRQFVSDKNYQQGQFMPPTFTWNLKGMHKIMSIDNIQGAEDPVWKNTLITSPDIKTMVRKIGNFTYNVHQDNKRYRPI